MKSSKKKLLWFVIFLILIAVTLRATMSGATEFTAERFSETLFGASPFWMVMAFLCMLGFVFFERLVKCS